MSRPISQRADDLLRTAHRSGRRAGRLARALQHRLQPLPGLSGPTARRRKAPRFPTSASAAGSGGWRSPPDSSSARGGISTIRSSFCYARRRGPDLSQAQPGVLGAVSIPSRPLAAGRLDSLGTGRLRHLRRHDLSQGLERLSGSDRPGRGVGGLARLRRSRFGPPALAASAMSARSRGRFRPRSRWTSASRSSSPTSVARPARPSRCSGRGSRTGSPARAASATAGMARPCVPVDEPALLIASITLHHSEV